MAKRKNAEISGQLEQVGKNFQRLLYENGLSVREVAEKTGQYIKTLNSILKGGDCLISTLLSVSNSLGVKIDVFFVEQDGEVPLYTLPGRRKRQYRLKNSILGMIGKGGLVKPVRCIDVVKFLYDNNNIDTNTKAVSSVLGRLVEAGLVKYKYDQSNHKLYFAP